MSIGTFPARTDTRNIISTAVAALALLYILEPVNEFGREAVCSGNEQETIPE